MPSEAQINKGYLLPEIISPHDLICVRMKVPNDLNHRAAFYGALTELTYWWNWERDDDKRGTLAAQYWRNLIYEHLIIQDCDELEFLDGGDMAQFRQCWFLTEDGYILRYTLNDGCTWVDVKDCDGNPVAFPIGEVGQNPPTDPIDQPGTFPDPILTPEARCRIINVTFEVLFSRSVSFFNGAINVAAGSRAYGIQQFLDSIDEAGNGLQWFEPFKALVEEHVPYIANIENVIGDDLYGDYMVCLICECIGLDPTPTREMLRCIADSLDALFTPVVGDLYYFAQYVADFLRVYPLAVIRADAFRDAVNPAYSSVCCEDCDPPPVSGCIPRFVTFDLPATHPYNLVVGNLAGGRTGQAAQSVYLPPNTFSQQSGIVKEAAIQVFVSMTSVCAVRFLQWRMRIKVGNPANAAGLHVKPPCYITTRNAGAVTRILEHRPDNLSYIWEGEWVLVTADFPVGAYPLADEVELVVVMGTSYAERTIDIRIDDLAIDVVP